MLEYITVKSHRFRPVGEKIQRLRKSIEWNGETLYCFESEPYGLSIFDVEKLTEDRLGTLMSAMHKSKIAYSVERKEI